MTDAPDVPRLAVAMADDARLTGVTRRRFLKAALAPSGTPVSGGALMSIPQACASRSNNTTPPNPRGLVGVSRDPDPPPPPASGLIPAAAISHCIFDPLIWALPGHGANPF